MEIITTSSRGQIVIPENVRKKYNIKKGTRLVLFDQGSRLVLEKEEKVKKVLQQTDHSGWEMVAEKSFSDVWDNEKDDRIWKKYL